MNNDEQIPAQKRAFFSWRPAAWLRVTGTDAFTFLQGQLTNDLRNLGPGGVVYGLWLNHKGRVQGDGFVVHGRADEWWIGSYFSDTAALRTHLESFVIADDVVIEDATAAWAGVSLIGEGADTMMPPAGGAVFNFPGHRGAAGSREWVFPVGLADEVRRRLVDWPEVDAAEIERLRIQAGIPAVPADIGPGELPNEGGLEDTAISYTKGCYLGQEVMARLKSMGQVRRKLVRVRGVGPVPSLPAEVVQGGRKVGELRSAAPEGDGFIGLALVTLLNVRPGEPLALAEAAGGGALTWEGAS